MGRTADSPLPERRYWICRWSAAPNFPEFGLQSGRRTLYRNGIPLMEGIQQIAECEYWECSLFQGWTFWTEARTICKRSIRFKKQKNCCSMSWIGKAVGRIPWKCFHRQSSLSHFSSGVQLTIYVSIRRWFQGYTRRQTDNCLLSRLGWCHQKAEHVPWHWTCASYHRVVSRICWLCNLWRTTRKIPDSEEMCSDISPCRSGRGFSY